MTDRLHALTVVLEPNKRDDDVQPIIDAIMMLRGVVSVEPHVADHTYHAARETVRRELGEKLWAVLHGDRRG